jgi:hypothetical protein
MSFYRSLKEICLNRRRRKAFLIGGSMSALATTTSGEALGRLTRDDIPFLFDALSISPDGTIVHTAREALRFSFDYQGITFNAEGRREGDSFILAIVADLGPLPFSAESAPARRAIQDLVLASSAMIGPRISISDDQAIRVDASLALLKPVSPVTTLTLVTELLLILKPWLARLGALIESASQTPAAPPASLN